MDMCYVTKNNGLRVCVMIDGDRDDDGNITTVHTMYVIFSKRYTRGFYPIGGTYCPRCIRERRYRIPQERWAAVNAKYCHGELEI